jgi:hypothetical protein
MKDLLDILQNANSLPTPTLYFFVIVVVLYFSCLWWKSYLSDTAIIKRQKQKLELIKLGLEIEELRQKLPSSEEEFAKDNTLHAVFELLHESKKNKIKATLEAFTFNPFKFLMGLSSHRPKWLRCFLMGGLMASVYPIVIICYTLLHLPPNTSAETLHAVFWIQLGFLAFTVVAGAIIAATFSFGSLLAACFMGCVSGIALFQLAGGLFILINNLRLVFLNAH